MLYARECIELMAAFPGRDFRIGEIIKYVNGGKALDGKRRLAIRVGVYRVMQQLSESGSVLIRPSSAKRGGYANYRWR